ncbi:MAG: SLC13 family permease [Woeseiaceae bacterium]
MFAILVYVLFRPDELPNQATTTAAIATWMAIWWATGAVNVAVTALLPVVIFPIAGIAPIAETTQSYAHPIIYLFMGGFVMALAIENSGLHKRVALIVFRLAGMNARAIVGGFIAAAAAISMWVSNTSTALMMLPIALSVVSVIRTSVTNLDETDIRNFELSLLLGLAYGASMGGVATLVGTPPNAFMAGFMQSTYGIEVDFARWMLIGIPLTVLMLPIIWLVLAKVLYPVNFSVSKQTVSHLSRMRSALGPPSPAEIRTSMLFAALIGGWVLRKPIAAWTGAAQLSDAGIAMAVAVLTFLVSSGKDGKALIVWDDMKRLPWDVLVLFGGGLSLAGGVTSSGLAQWIGNLLAPLGTMHIAILVVTACALIIFLTELTSNTATTATFLPVIGALAMQTGHNPLVLVAPATLAASLAFMLPVATPPNAVAFSSGRVPIPSMMRAGLILNLVGIVVLTIVSVVIVPVVF